MIKKYLERCAARLTFREAPPEGEFRPETRSAVPGNRESSPGAGHGRSRGCSPEEVIETLQQRGDLWERSPGLTVLRGDALAMFRVLEHQIKALARDAEADEWRVSTGLSFEALASGEYRDSFPRWLTAASHLRDEPLAPEPPLANPGSGAALADAARAPAVCYHAYAALSGRTLESPTVMTAQTTCCPHGESSEPVRRARTLTLREIVCLGTPEEVEAFRRKMKQDVLRLADRLGLEYVLMEGDDHLVPPTARGRALLHRVRARKEELALKTDASGSVVAASFNYHATFFGETFDIRLPDGTPAASSCVAFGMERWLLAFLCTHGTDPAEWPVIDNGPPMPYRA
jgi:hypothetical protein